MIVVGAGGHALEILDVLLEKHNQENVMFFDNVSKEFNENISSKYIILKDNNLLGRYLKVDNRYILGIGSPYLRRDLNSLFRNFGGEILTVASATAIISNFNVTLGKGLNIMPFAFISSSVVIGDGVLLNSRASIHHDSLIGNFVEISPGATILGHCNIGSYSSIGAKAVILPKVKIGNNVIIGAGSIVTKDIPDNVIAYGNPARIVRKNEFK